MKSRLSGAEGHCWHLIQDNISRIPNLSITQLSAEAHVSASTIMRTLKKLGYDGYADFKQTVRNTKQKRYQNGFSNEVNLAIRKNEVEVTRTINQLSADDIEAAIKLIDAHSHIMIFCAGLSVNVAREMADKLQILGKFCVIHDDFDYMQYFASKATCLDLIVAFSLSGETIEIVQALAKAKKNGAKVLALVGATTSAIGSQAHVCLHAYKSSQKTINLGLDVGSRLCLQVVNRILLDAFALYKNLAPIRRADHGPNI